MRLSVNGKMEKFFSEKKWNLWYFEKANFQHKKYRAPALN